jgi:oxygen-dependent protoporphyrinogen oxidase
MPPRADVVVIGAGLSGLVAAHTLHRRGVVVRVLESGERPGGVIASIRSEGFLHETAANSALDNQPAVGELIESLGLKNERLDVPAGARRYVVRDGKPVVLPGSPPALVATRAFGLAGKLRLLCEPLVARGDPSREESIAEFALRRLGREVLDYAVDPFVSGVYAGDPARISASAAFPRLVALEREHGSLVRGQLAQARARGAPARSRSFSFRAGMQCLTDALAAGLPAIDYGARASSLRPRPDGGYALDVERAGGLRERLDADALVLAIPAYAASELARPAFAAAATVLDQVEYAPVAIVATGYARGDVAHPLDGFGMLVPSVERSDLLGTLFSSSLFPGRALPGQVLLTSFVGGARRPELAMADEGALATSVDAELARLLGAGTPLWRRIVRWPRAIPQYTLGHGRRMAELDAALASEARLRLVGNWRGGVAVGDCIANARASAESLAGMAGRA